LPPFCLGFKRLEGDLRRDTRSGTSARGWQAGNKVYFAVVSKELATETTREVKVSTGQNKKGK